MISSSKRAALLLLATCAMSGSYAAVPRLLETLPWVQGTPLEVRAGKPDGLLLRQEGRAVYRWRPGDAFAAADDGAWLAVGTPVAACADQRASRAVSIDVSGARVGNIRLNLLGQRAEKATSSHDARRAAVLSSSGKGGSVAPFLGSGGKAPFFIDFIDVDRIRPDASAARLPFDDKVAALQLCWSADDRYLLVHDLVHRWLVVLPTQNGEHAR